MRRAPHTLQRKQSETPGVCADTGCLNLPFVPYKDTGCLSQPFPHWKQMLYSLAMAWLMRSRAFSMLAWELA